MNDSEKIQLLQDTIDNMSVVGNYYLDQEWWRTGQKIMDGVKCLREALDDIKKITDTDDMDIAVMVDAIFYEREA